MENILPVGYLDGWKLFVELYDISTRATLSKQDVEEIGLNAEKFFLHVEEYYYQYKVENIKVMKYTLHLLLHLKDNILRNGPPAYYSQYWVERFIGGLVSRLNARRSATTVLFRSCLFNESAKIIYDLPFHSSDEEYKEVQAYSGYQLYGKGKKLSWNSSSVPTSIKNALLYYMARKWPYLSSNNCEKLYDRILEVISFPRLKVLNGNQVECIGSCGDTKDLSNIKFRQQAPYYCAAQMNEDMKGCDVFYGRIRYYLRIVFNDENELVMNLLEQSIQFDLVVMDWAVRLTKGNQGQVRSLGTSYGAFSHLSIEDISIVNRQISVVDHFVPSHE